MKNISSLEDLFSSNSSYKNFRVVSIPASENDIYTYDSKKEGKDNNKNTSTTKPTKLPVEKLDNHNKS